MKVWISIAAVAAFALIGTLGTMIHRGRTQAGDGLVLEGELARRGLQVANAQGCTACHSLDGSPGIGPTWLGMYGRTVRLADGTTVVADADYIRESIRDPAARVVSGFQNVMVPYGLSGEEMEALLEFTRQLGTR